MRPNIHHQVTFLVIALSVTGLNGCNSGTSSSNSSKAGSPVASASLDAPGHPEWIPSLADLRAHVQMTDAQATSIDATLKKWQTAVANRPGKKHPREMFTAAKAGQVLPPAAMFLSESGKVLQTDQFVALVQYLKEKRSEQKTQVAEVRSQLRGVGIDRMVRRMVDQLALIPDQEKRVRQTLQESWASRAEADSNGHSLLPHDSLQFRGLHQQLAERLNEILTPEQRATFASLQAKRSEKRSGIKDKWQEARISNAVECLQGVLQLNESQSAQIRQAFTQMSASRPSESAYGAGPHRFGRPLMQDAGLFHKLESDIRAVLTPDQIRRFDAVLELLPGRGARS